MGPSSPPPAPDPVKTAEAQTASNVKTATTQQQLNMVDQTTPYGNLNYTQNGTWADGTPKYSSSVTLSPEEQKLYGQQTQIGSGMNDLAINQIGKLNTLLGTPVDLSNAATENRLMELGRSRLDPILAQRRNSAVTDLVQRGFTPGTEAYDRAMLGVTQGENDAYNQLLLSGRGQAVQEALTQRNQPINEITALMSGGQVSQPNFTGTPQSAVAPTDVAGITQQGYQNSLVPWQAQNSYNQALMGGLFSLGGAALGGWGRGGFQMPKFGG